MVMRLIIEPIVRAALLEDLGRAGDITSDAIVPPDARVEAVIAARQPGVVAGLEAALLAFELLEPALSHRAPARRRRPGRARRQGRTHCRPGARPCSPPSAPRSTCCAACPGSPPRRARWPMRSPATRPGSSAPARPRPGCASSEKEAVRLGGGANHRFGLDDAMLIKDNHIAMAGGVEPALRARPRPRRSSRQDRARGRHAGSARRGARMSASMRSCSTI